MIKITLLFAVLSPLLSFAAAPADPVQVVEIIAARDAEWAGYRHAYKANAMFADYIRPYPLVQAHMQIRPLKPDRSMEGLRIQLAGATTSAEIAVDRVGRAVLPINDQAYKEDAVLRLNRGKGLYYFSGRFTIRERADGVYDAGLLRDACNQMLSVQRDAGARLRLFRKKCVGVEFIYAASEKTPGLMFSNDVTVEAPILAVDGPAFQDKAMGVYKVAAFRFADWPPDGAVVAKVRPLAITSIYE